MDYRRVLVTGAAGLLGQSVVKEFQPHCQIRGLDLKRGSAEIEWHVGDLTDADVVAAAVKDVDAIVHVGAIPNIWSGDGEKIMRVNVLGTYLLLAAAELQELSGLLFAPAIPRSDLRSVRAR